MTETAVRPGQQPRSEKASPSFSKSDLSHVKRAQHTARAVPAWPWPPFRLTDRTTCHKWASHQRQTKEDRLVLSCLKCPVSRPSRRRSIRWGHVAKELGVTLPALRAAIETERRRGEVDQIERTK